MKTQPLSHPRAALRAAHQPGLAIVVVVSLMALLMLLVLAFLLTSSTNRNISSTDVAIRQADSVAELAKETFVSDLLAEMKDGSQNIQQNADGSYAFSIDTPRNMVPSRAVRSNIGSDPIYRNIVKQSADGVTTHSLGRSGVQRASSVSTSQPDLDGRSIAPKRWSAPKLLAPGQELANNQVPDWIYTTRSGTNPTRFSQNNSQSTDSTGVVNPDYIVGRYAYQVYDVSGLLDANVVGNDSQNPPVGVLSRKGSLVWADLSVLPNYNSNPGALGDWRRISSKNWPKGISASSVEDFIREWGQVNGWMKTPVVNNNSDNLFLTRKDLIAYQKANPNAIPESALPYLTTNSLALNRPSWAPTSSAGGGFDYKGRKDDPTSPNRRIAGVLVKNGFTRRDGTTAKPGEPLIISPFPLSKINAFTTNNMADIAKYFGLVRGSSAGTWIYTNFSNSRIRTLEELATLSPPREPDFFEMLKAGLLNGSLAVANRSDGFFKDTIRDGNEAYQILRIGANIIDQWDTDDDPTVIEFGVANPLTGVRSEDVAGVENLPYFHFLTESRFRRRDAEPPNDPIACTYINFQLWNPHRNPILGKCASGAIRIAFAGTSFMAWNTSSSNQEAGYTPYARNSEKRTATFDQDFIEFTIGTGTSSFSTPVYLKPGIAGARASRPGDSTTVGEAPVIGYKVGEINAPYADAPAGHTVRYSSNGLFSRYEPSMSFALQKNVRGVWVNYQIIPEWTLTHGFVIGSLNDNTTRLYSAKGDYANLHGMLIDPRTTRHGISSTTNAQLAIGKTTGGRSYDNKFFPPANWITPGNRVPEQYQSNSPGGRSVMFNRDGTRWPSDGGEPFSMTDPNQRPEILNRPFQSVVEMGMAFRDQPWTSLNFFGDSDDLTNPGDGALLDLFSLTETPTRGGVLNPNAAPAAVLQTLLSQASVHEGGITLSNDLAKSYATAIRTQLDSNPIVSLGEITTLTSTVIKSSKVTGQLNNKAREVIGRALSDVSNVRTWNFLIDIIAQSGKIPPSASSLESFVTQGERRLWYNIAIDRVTGEVISAKRETIFE
jgi:type II secretory pathway pseudopilin PulG